MRTAFTFTVGAIALSFAQVAAAQDDPLADAPSYDEDTGGFGDIIVTANKRGENLQRVPISVSAYSGDQLESLGISEATQITQQIPGLQLNAWSQCV